MHQVKFLALATAAALLSACAGGGQTVPSAAGGQPPRAAGSGLTLLSRYKAIDNQTGAVLRLLPPRDVFAAARPDRQRHDRQPALRRRPGADRAPPLRRVLGRGVEHHRRPERRRRRG